MAHVEIKFIPLNFSGNMIDQPINIDCWRATLVFRSGDSTRWRIDGIRWDFLDDPSVGRTDVQRIELGGLVVDGKPVNIKHDLRFTADGDTIAALLVLQYYIQ